MIVYYIMYNTQYYILRLSVVHLYTGKLSQITHEPVKECF